MNLENCIDQLLFPLKPSDTVEFARESMNAYGLTALPVSEQGKIRGFVLNRKLEHLNSLDVIEPYLEIHNDWIVFDKQHYVEAFRRFSEFKAECLAVCDEYAKFRGIISKSSFIELLAGSYTTSAEGSVMILEMVARNYSLHEITRLIENENAKILGINIFQIPDSSRIQVHIKINTIYSDRILLSLERFGYEIGGSFYGKSEITDYESRYQSLLKYLEF